MQFYRIKDLDRIGKVDGGIPYLFAASGWEVDDANILMDRVMGYDGESIGCISMLSRVEEITEEEALAAIKEQQ